MENGNQGIHAAKRIVIIGGGFAGVAAGLHLKKKLKENEAEILLIDKQPYHLFTPSLYEVATSEIPNKDIVIPFYAIFESGVKIVTGEVEKIDANANTILLTNQETVAYDYLIITVGSVPSYMGIEGLEDYSVGFKTIKDALIIKEKVKSMCCKEGECTRKVQLVIGGGGFAGTELAAELLMYKNKLAKQEGLDRNCLEITIIQGSDHLLNELDPHVSALAQKRVAGSAVKFGFGGHINKVDSEKIYTDNGKEYPYDIFVWTGGVEANHLAKDSELPVSKHGQLLVDQCLQVEGRQNIFSAGDVAGFIDPKTQKPVPNVAQVAEEQGAVVAENVVRLIHGEKLKPYKYRHFGYVVPLRGRFAAAELMYGIHFDGFFGWILQQIVLLRYLFGILPYWKAWKRWNVIELELEH